MEDPPPPLAPPIPHRHVPLSFLHPLPSSTPPLKIPPTPNTCHPPNTGLDLQGNTYWEFLDRGTPLPKHPPTQNHPTDQAHQQPPQIRYRRIVRPADSASTHPADIKVPPAWHQWLRHTRSDAPSLAEQRGEVQRRERMRVLARLADERWEAKGKVMEGSGSSSSQQQQEREQIGRPALGEVVKEGAVEVEVPKQSEADPWKQADRSGPGEAWTPKSWEPGSGSGGRK